MSQLLKLCVIMGYLMYFSFAPSSLKATQTKTCTLSDYKVEVLQLVPDCE